MNTSVLNMYRIGIGPSSSHTVGPMRAARYFLKELQDKGFFPLVKKMRIELWGSLAATGKGHATDQAILLGLMGKSPSTIAIDHIDDWIREIREDKLLLLDSRLPIKFDADKDLLFLPEKVDPHHTNTMIFKAMDDKDRLLLEEKIYSPGGGFIEAEKDMIAKNSSSFTDAQIHTEKSVPFPYKTASELLTQCSKFNLKISELVRLNERTFRQDDVLNADLDQIWSVMRGCIDRGLHAKGVLPGPMKIERRAPTLYRNLKKNLLNVVDDPLQVMDWVSVFAIAVSEENAAGGRVVTAPTNGAAGVIPAVINYYRRFVTGANQEGIRKFLLVAAAIGNLYKTNASISGAEVGCQGEIGVACSMASAGLAAALDANNSQIENAAEIGMEHHLGLTCDPLHGQVQIPCIERNAVAAVKAINSARLAMMGDGKHHVSLDQVIETMLKTGKDMKSQYKETSLGGLAVCVIEC